MNVLVTGADGFVGRHLVPRLLEAGNTVVAACRPGGDPVTGWLEPRWHSQVRVIPLEITDAESVRAAVSPDCDAVVHLAAVASVSEARHDPGRAWIVNAAGTARVLEAAAALQRAGGPGPLVLVVSSAEVYGSGPATPRRETDPVAPQSTYAASKVGTEMAALEAWRRSGLRIVIARPFQHTGPGQAPQYVVPAFARRVIAARQSGSATVATGNLEPVRDLLDVRDVARAYLALLQRGVPGEIYNIARGEGISLRQLFERLATLAGARVEPVPDPSLIRAGDIPYLVGDPGKLRQATGWSPEYSLDQTLQELVHA